MSGRASEPTLFIRPDLAAFVSSMLLLPFQCRSIGQRATLVRCGFRARIEATAARSSESACFGRLARSDGGSARAACFNSSGCPQRSDAVGDSGAVIARRRGRGKRTLLCGDLSAFTAAATDGSGFWPIDQPPIAPVADRLPANGKNGNRHRSGPKIPRPSSPACR